MEQHTQNGWAGGDRVYCVAQPDLTGTVVDTTNSGRRVQVQWDSLRFPDWRNALDLDCYTLPRGN